MLALQNATEAAERLEDVQAQLRAKDVALALAEQRTKEVEEEKARVRELLGQGPATGAQASLVSEAALYAGAAWALGQSMRFVLESGASSVTEAGDGKSDDWLRRALSIRAAAAAAGSRGGSGHAPEHFRLHPSLLIENGSRGEGQAMGSGSVVRRQVGHGADGDEEVQMTLVRDIRADVVEALAASALVATDADFKAETVACLGDLHS